MNDFNSVAKLTLEGEEYTLKIASDAVVIPESFLKKLASKIVTDYKPGDIILFDYPSGFLQPIEILNGGDENLLLANRNFYVSATFKASKRKLA